MQQQQTENGRKRLPQVWAVGGGKGGIGKSVLSILISVALAESGKDTVVIDGDLGGANLHTFMGIRTPSRTLNDFISRQVDKLDDVCMGTEQKGLRIICGASEVLTLANLQYTQKIKILQAISRIDADHVILDLGAGTGFNTLDFFLSAHRQIVVMTPQPVAIQNAYAFVRNAVYRTLSRLTSRRPSLGGLVKAAMNPKNDMQVRTVGALLDRMAENGDPAEAAAMAAHLNRIRPALITNMVREPRDKNAGRIIQMVSKKHLMIQAQIGGGVYFDPQINAMVSAMEPLTRVDRNSNAIQSALAIVSNLKNTGWASDDQSGCETGEERSPDRKISAVAGYP
ncbi:ATP-binding protein [Desulfosarcina alkanivorans]|uniref:ATP-binding protein n=1 Tax=Desulfosarcina alkanivorans TaxID=571177 RepID=A0A5K7YRQ7_9BACT|nr:P-loop NTPase [Desulfosarcina alkanivorans]BBO72502.1 ATP-binding protein [Desulfosarcina alkanivorans]